jgi:hypothetical protein
MHDGRVPDGSVRNHVTRAPLAPRIAPWLAIGTLFLLFLWIYGRFAPALHFVLDDPIETEVALARTWRAAVTGSFTGSINWSGYRPVTYALRATLAHLFGVQQMVGYYVVSLGLHLLNTLLTWRLVRRVAGNEAWAFLAAAIVLLLPAHNEAVLYMSASANLLALFFCLLTLEFALTARATARLWPQFVAAICLALAALAYEVTLPLIALIFAADWAMARAEVHAEGSAGVESTLRRHLPMYSAMIAAIVVVLAMRLWAGSGQMTSIRSDYALTMNPLRIVHGYLLLLGQMVLLHTSPWLHVPIFSNVRQWMEPTNARALASMALAFVLGSATLLVGMRAARSAGDRAPAAKPRPPMWVAWGVFWVAAMSLSFTMLAYRNPENRYTYIPSFGMAVAVTAGLAWLLPRGRWRPLAEGLVTAAAVALLTFYAYVDTSDVAEWERAAHHTRSFLAGASNVLPELPPSLDNVTLAQVGVPVDLGAAYLFSTDEGFAAAMRLHYGAPTLASLAGDLPLRARLENEADAAARTLLLGYSPERHEVRLVDSALICPTADVCTEYTLQNPTANGPTWRYALVGDPAAMGEGAVALLIDPGAAAPADCWFVTDIDRYEAGTRVWDSAAVAVRCQATLDALRDGGALQAPDAPQVSP